MAAAAAAAATAAIAGCGTGDAGRPETPVLDAAAATTLAAAALAADTPADESLVSVTGTKLPVATALEVMAAAMEAAAAAPDNGWNRDC